MGRIMLKEKKRCSEPGKDGCKDRQDHVERNKGFLNQERKDAKIYRILLILKSFLSWFKTNYPSKTIHPANPKILPFLVQDKLSFKDKTSC